MILSFAKILVSFLDTKIMAFAEIAKWNHFIFLQNDGLPGFLLNSFVQLLASNGLLIVWSPWKSVWHFSDIIHFVHTQFPENLSVFPWHQNYGFCRDREMKSFYFSPKWRSSGLPIEFFCVTAGFQRSSSCVKTVEVPLAFCFNIIHFVDTQFRENLSVFPWHENYGFCRDREMKSFYFSPKWRSSGLPIEFFCVTAGFQRSSYCVKPVESVWHFFYVIHFVDTQFPENLSLFHWHQNYGFCRDREMKPFYFSPKWQSSGLPIEFFCVTAGFQRRGSPSGIFFLCNTFCRYSVSRNLSVFHWHQNYGFCSDHEMKSFYFSPKWRSSGLPIEFFCLTAGFQRSSYCVKTMEVRRAFCFNIIHFLDTQFRENLSVFPWPQNYGFSRYREMKSFYFFSKLTVFRASYWILLCNCGLPTVFLLCEARGSPSGIFFI